MLKRLATLSVLALAVSASPATAGSAAAEDARIYRDSARGIELKYPNDWISTERAEVVGFVSPIEHNTEAFLANVNVLVVKLTSAPRTPDDFKRLAEDQIYRHFPHAQVHGFSTTTLAGLPAYQVLFTARQEFSNLLYRQVYAISGNQCYFVTYAADLHASDADFEANLRNAKTIFDSFQIIGPRPVDPLAAGRSAIDISA